MRINDKDKLKKRPINLTIREDLIRDAKAYGINTSAAAQEGVARAVKEAREKEWLENNKAAIEAHNARIQKEGVLIQPIWMRQD